MAIIGSILSWYFKKRIPQIERAMYQPGEVQQEMFASLIESGAQTEWGQKHDYRSVRTIQDFRNRVPLQTYESLKPYIDRTMRGEQRLLWPGEVKWFAKSSGTTHDKSKFIPISFECLEESHFKGGRDLLTIYCNNNPETRIFDGKGLVIGGSHKVNSFHEDSFYGDLSAVMMFNLPFWVHFLRTPDLSIALMDDWEKKIEMMANATINEDVTNISGVPTWTSVLIQRLFEMTGKKDLHEIWPNLELYVHGGVSFVPYRESFRKLMPSRSINYMETYNASEGFFGIQDQPDRNDLLLMTDYGIFYEFMPVSDLDSDNPHCYTLDEVDTDVNYAMVISTNTGLWRYQIGDTIRFTGKRPYRFVITGRTKLFINAFGEELMIDNAEQALAKACEKTNALIRDYTAAPIYFNTSGQDAGHEWLIEFEKHPESMQAFTEELDRMLKVINSDYEAKRHKDIALKMPKVRAVKDGTFYNWLKMKGKLGGQHKVPRLYNDRTYADEILMLMGDQNIQPV